MFTFTESNQKIIIELDLMSKKLVLDLRLGVLTSRVNLSNGRLNRNGSWSRNR